MMRALVIGPEQKAMIAGLRKMAEAAPLPLKRVQRLMQGGDYALAYRQFNEAATIEIPNGYRVTYTVEEQREGVLTRHLSVSLTDGPVSKAPHPAAMGMLMSEFGFRRGLTECKYWLEPVEGDKVAVNVLEPMDGNWEPLMTPLP